MRSTCTRCPARTDLSSKGALALCRSVIHLPVLPSVTESRFQWMCCQELYSSLLGKKDGIPDNQAHKGPSRGPTLTCAPITAGRVRILFQTQLSVPHTPLRKHLPSYTDPACNRNKSASSHPRGRRGGLIPGPRHPHLEEDPEAQISTKVAS